MKSQSLCFIFVFIFINLTFSQSNLETSADKKAIASKMRQILDDEFSRFFPSAIDSVYGGFFSDFNYRWELVGQQNKMIVTQARHIWSASNAALFYRANKTFFKIAGHGFKFLKEVMWDNEQGGFYNFVSRKGEPLEENDRILKYTYGNAFAIYGLSAYYKASNDTNALELARKTFYWLEKNSFDSVYGGYFQFMQIDGTPFKNGFRVNQKLWYPPKDQNSSIHLLESFTELYSVWPDSLLRKRLLHLLNLIQNKIVTEKGYMNLFFLQDWTPVSYRDSSDEVRAHNYYFDHVSFGHDIETAYLLLEASETLGLKNDTTTLRIAKKMVDHSLQYGWDDQNGGLFDRGYYFAGETKPKIIQQLKEWWSQAEALNSLLMMYELFPHERKYYYKKFLDQWKYCEQYLIDQEFGGWFWGGLDQDPAIRTSPKASIWKGNYHTSRSLINCIKRLEK